MIEDNGAHSFTEGAECGDQKHKETTPLNETEYFKEENDFVLEHFDLYAVLDFCKSHDVQIIRGADFQYQCYIDGKVYYSSLTPIHALWAGIKKHSNATRTSPVS